MSTALRIASGFLLLATVFAQQPAVPVGPTLFGGVPVLDLDGDVARQSTVRRVLRKYLGHPTTAQLLRGESLLCVFPEGHGQGQIVLVRTDDGGVTWSEPMPVPASWATSKETPTIHHLVDPRDGVRRLVVFSGLHPIRSSISTNDGRTWTELQPIGDFGGIVAMSAVTRLANGSYAAFFHDDGRYFRAGGKAEGTFTLYQTLSTDGGQTWSQPRVLWSGSDVHLCEPGVIRSPDGKRLVMLLRENRRQRQSHVMVSDDEAATWSAPRELPATLTGDRHVGVYGPEDRLFVSFRDMADGSPTRGDWIAWVGTFDDIVNGRPGQYRVRLSRNWRGTDCGYPGVEVLPDDTIVAVSYGHWEPGEAPFVRCVRLRFDELDALAKQQRPLPPREPGTVRPTPRIEPWWQQRVAEDLAAAKAGGNRLLFVGDSITQGFRDGGKAVWAERFAPLGGLNLGVSGDRTQNVLWRFDHGLVEALAADNNDVRGAVVMIGTNNSNGDECTAQEIADGVVAVVQRLRRGLPKAKVLLLAIFPRGEQPGPQRSKNAEASRLAAAAFAADPMVVTRDLAAHFVGDGDRIDKAVMPDFLHLTPAAYKTWGDAIAADVAALLR